jgi:hypothetical protein
MTTATMSLEDAAAEMAGNWKKFDSFAWFRSREIDDPASWAVIYTHTRESGLLDRSNAAVIAKALEPFTDGDDPDVVVESHSHWAVGHVDGFSMRVMTDGAVTAAFKVYHELQKRMDDYPVLDESDYSNREYDATLENIGNSARRLKREFTLPEGWESDVFGWFSDNDQSAVENTDDQGGYPDEDDLRVAFKALKYEPIEA